MADGTKETLNFQVKVDFHRKAYDAVLYKLIRTQTLGATDLAIPSIQGKNADQVIVEELGGTRWPIKRNDAISKSGLTISEALSNQVDELAKEAIHDYLQAFRAQYLLQFSRRDSVRTHRANISREQEYLSKPYEGRDKIIGILTNHVLNRTVNGLRALGFDATGAQALSGTIIREAVTIQCNISREHTRVEPQLGALPPSFTKATVAERGQKIAKYWQDTAKEINQDRTRILHQEGGRWR